MLAIHAAQPLGPGRLACTVGGAMQEPLVGIVFVRHAPVGVVRDRHGVAVQSTDPALVLAHLQAAVT
eukprot:10721587-Heterocapsa_arctica.AAC.1